MSTDELIEESSALTPKGQATRDRIVATAAELIHDNGIANTSLGDVQKAAQVGASQVYHYFSDKQALIRAVVDYRVTGVLETVRSTEGGLTSIEALRAWRDMLVELHRQRNCQGGCPLGSLVGELAEISPEFRDDLAEGFGKWRGSIREGLGVMQSNGELRRNADLDRLATAFLAAVEGGILLSQLQRDTLPLETALDDVLDRIEALRPRRALSRAK